MLLQLTLAMMLLHTSTGTALHSTFLTPNFLPVEVKQAA
jgi:hypothetical protein